MSEELNMADKQSQRLAQVLRLHLADGFSARAIARKLGMSRNTVRRMLHRTPPKPPKQANPPRTSLLAPYDATVRKLLSDAPEIKAPAVLERLRPMGYAGGVTLIRQLLRRLRPVQSREAFLTLDFPPGAAAQVDWADFGFALPGCPRRVSAFVMVLCYSRYLYLEFALSQSMGSFLRRMENAVRFFGATAHLDVFDNMRTVVSSHGPTGIVFNSRFLEYARARGFSVQACNVGRGHEKGRVERPIGFVRERFWRGRRFQDLFDLNAQATAWRDKFANARVHEVTGKVPSLVFENEEKRLLKPLPENAFETDEIEGAGVTKSFRVRFDRNTYSVPPRLVGQSVVIRANDETVSIFLGPKQVALHPRCWKVGQDIEHPSHREAALEKKPKAAAGELPPGLAGLGEIGVRYFKLLSASTRSLNREAVRVTLLSELFGEGVVASAIEEVMQTGHVGAEYVEYVLRHKKGLQPAAMPLRLGNPELDGLSFREPDLSVYDALFPPARTLDPGVPSTAPEEKGDEP